MGLTLDEGRGWGDALMGLGSSASLVNARASPIVRVHLSGPRPPPITNQVKAIKAQSAVRALSLPTTYDTTFVRLVCAVWRMYAITVCCNGVVAIIVSRNSHRQATPSKWRWCTFSGP
ncbi:hypothetical protein GW17_00003433 [Ensete ventricosum]|nr:hypothetical protein GW17_00003433 [Ensete ventricosum]